MPVKLGAAPLNPNSLEISNPIFLLLLPRSRHRLPYAIPCTFPPPHHTVRSLNLDSCYSTRFGPPHFLVVLAVLFYLLVHVVVRQSSILRESYLSSGIFSRAEYDASMHDIVIKRRIAYPHAPEVTSKPR